MGSLMDVDWNLAASIVLPISTLILGKYLDRWLTKRPKLVVYFGHTSAFTLRGQTTGVIHTHAIVIRNTGRETANNVRIGHNVLPNHYQLFPAVPYTVLQNPGATTEVVISKMVPDEQITVSYLYFPPLLWSQIHAYTKSDEGFARVLNVLPTPQHPKWVLTSLWALVFIGAVSVLYVLVLLTRSLFF